MGKIKEMFSGPKLTVVKTLPTTPELEAHAEMVVAEVERRVAESVGYAAARGASTRPFWRRKGAYFIKGYEGAYTEGFPTTNSPEEAQQSVDALIERAEAAVNQQTIEEA